MEPIDLERDEPPNSLSGYAKGEIMTLEISDVSPDLLVLQVKENNLPENIHGNLDVEMEADVHEDADDEEDVHGFANVELQFFPCDACEASFTSEPELEQHFRSSHSICDVLSERGRPKTKSVETESVTNVHTCMTCGKVFKYLTSFRKHEESHNIKPLYTCKTCGKNFKYVTSFAKHEETHVVPEQEENEEEENEEEEDEEEYEEEEEEEEVERSEGRRMGIPIKANVLSVNQNTKALHTCRHCGKMFKYATSFIKHEMTHRILLNRKEKRIAPKSEIDIGMRKVAIETNVRTIRKNSEDGEGQESSIVISSDEEIATTPEPQKKKSKLSPPFPCKDCGKIFQFFKSYQKHQKRHAWAQGRSEAMPPKESHGAEEKEIITCPVCGRVFNRHTTLMRHQQMYHLTNNSLANTNDFTCCECDRHFDKADSIQKHKCFHLRKHVKGFIEAGRVSQPGNVYHCQLCALTLTSGLDFENHAKDTHEDQYRKIIKAVGNVKKYIMKDTLKGLQTQRDSNHSANQTSQSSSQAANQTSQSSSQAANQTSQSSSQAANQTASQSANQTASQSSSQSANQTASQSSSQAANQATNQTGSKIDFNRAGETNEDVSRQFICKDCGDCFIYHASFNFCGKCLTLRKNVKKYHCKECGQAFGRKDHLKRHSYSHSGSLFICSDCGIKFRDPGELRTHEKTHRVRNHVCQLCEKRFEKQEELMLHGEVAHPGPDGYMCHQCGKIFSKVKNLGKHRMIHSYKNPHVCSHCGKKFKRQENLRRHESLYNNEKPHLCHCCGDRFARKEDLNAHVGRMHTMLGKGNYVCKACGMTFKDRNSLRRHRYHVHIKAGKAYKCEECGLSFSRADHLKRHQSTHSSQRPFSCSVCNKVFHRADNLKTHQRNHRNKWLKYIATRRHDKTPEMESNVSESSAWKLGRSEASALLKVIQSYSKQKHHNCCVCKKTFRDLYHLKRHRLLNCGGERNTMDSFRFRNVK